MITFKIMVIYSQIFLDKLNIRPTKRTLEIGFYLHYVDMNSGEREVS